PPDIVQNTIGNIWQVLDIINNLTKFFLSKLLHLITSLPNYFILLIITIIATFFFARDFEYIKENATKLIPLKWQPYFVRITTSLNKAMIGYLKAILILTSITGFISLVGLTVLNVNYSHVLAIVAALFDLLPVLGPGTLYLPWSVWLLISGNIPLGIGILILYGIIVLARQLLEPKIIGQSIGLHPLTTLIALYVGLSLLGFWGIILGPAAVIAYKAFIEEKRKE
ncbi:MAG: sporulation integral membrane protein YtvI, partial [Fervidicoccus fontis]